ncbi:hypothetical protein [Novipirellula caenicola]|uniref:Uncharacterized protein n=1 Tax=Novipirellula caenicola TaxID=1536901 RepID=A0ABP9W1J1_9BACT
MTPLQSDRHQELTQLVACKPADCWPAILDLWTSTKKIYTLPAGPNGYIDPAYELVELICERIDDFFPMLNQEVTHSNPNVCAYCLTCLERVDRLQLTAEQLQELRQRDEVLDVVSGCFGSTPTLARFVELSGQSYL